MKFLFNLKGAEQTENIAEESLTEQELASVTGGWRGGCYDDYDDYDDYCDDDYWYSGGYRRYGRRGRRGYDRGCDY